MGKKRPWSAWHFYINTNEKQVKMRTWKKKIAEIEIKNFRGRDKMTIKDLDTVLVQGSDRGDLLRELSAFVATVLSLVIFQELGLIQSNVYTDWRKLKNLQIWLWIKATSGTKYGMRHVRRWVFEALEMQRYDIAKLPLRSYHHPHNLIFRINKEHWNKLDEEYQVDERPYDLF